MESNLPLCDATLIWRKHLATAPILKDLFKTEGPLLATDPSVMQSVLANQ